VRQSRRINATARVESAMRTWPNIKLAGEFADGFYQRGWDCWTGDPIARLRPATAGSILAIASQAEGPMKHKQWRGSRVLTRYLAWVICAAVLGCVNHNTTVPSDAPIPRELRMTTLPPYMSALSVIFLYRRKRFFAGFRAFSESRRGLAASRSSHYCPTDRVFPRFLSVRV
jgi:hypothetical protein